MSVLALAACGGSNEDEVVSGTVTGEDGETAEYRISEGDDGEVSYKVESEDGSFELNANSDKPVDLPFGLTLPRGADVQTNMTMNQGEGRPSSTTVIFQTKQSADDIIAFYKAKAKAEGFKVKTEITSQGTKMFVSQRGDKESINVSVTEQENGVNVANVSAVTKP
ncbi:MAG: hypothetical protein AAFX04_07410 [Pseudomonadota bacterium]